LSVDAFHDRFTDLSSFEGEVRPVGAVGGVVSGAFVVTVTALLDAETFPALSFAFTVNVYEVLAVKFDAVYDVAPPVEPINVVPR
jgi:hypothetical protein